MKTIAKFEAENTHFFKASSLLKLPINDYIYQISTSDSPIFNNAEEIKADMKFYTLSDDIFRQSVYQTINTLS